jgi:Ran GTPase-activating protein (RanGAP) involved in mRNA processing and transport
MYALGRCGVVCFVSLRVAHFAVTFFSGHDFALFSRMQIDLSRRGLGVNEAELICNTLRNNPQVAVLKLGYNEFGDQGTSMIAQSCSKDGRHHPNLTILDLGFNGIGDEGCTALSLHMVAGNHTLRNLFLSGNNIRRKGATALAGAIMHGCSLSRLHLSANRLGTAGFKVLAQSIAEAEARVQQLLQRQGGIKIGYSIKPVTLEELHVDDVSMKANGIATLSSMLLTNFNLSTIALANNNIDDQDMALLSQALAQNKSLPLKSLILSFNNISCAGVECLMNAVWGSSTLREVRLDNNKVQDRGAQLCSVVLSSIRLEVIDISFNRISTVGIKALMKSLSENDSLKRLSLCGIPMDQNASKAVSYALAYNQSLERFNIDSCSVGYSGQRHIVAGIVSNRNVKLRVLTGFPLGREYFFC